MALPNDQLSDIPVTASILAPDGWGRELWQDFERGGVAVQDPTQGNDVRMWRAWSDGSSIWCSPHPEGAPATLLISGSGITELSLAFDQNMNPSLAYVEAGMVKLWWFDTIANDMVVTEFATARSPMLTLDDKRWSAGQASDIIFAYIRDNQLRYRQQRDRYTIERTLGALLTDESRLTNLGMGVNNRLQFQVGVGPPPLRAVFADRAGGEMFVLDGNDIRPWGAGAPELGTWRSRTFVMQERPAPVWVRVEGDYPMRLRLIGDGLILYETPPIMSPAPLRLPAVRGREWAVELEGFGRVVQLAMAQDRGDL